MKHIIISTIAAAFMLLSTTVDAQNIRKANKEFELHAFNLAIKSYRAVLNSDPTNAEALYKTAECYRHLNQIDQAIGYYQKAVAQAKVDPAAYFNFGLSLVNQARYADAKNWFLKYAETNPYVGSHYAENCDYATSLQGIPALYRVKKEYLNKSASDFGAAFYKDFVVYSSSRGDMKRETETGSANWTGLAKNQLFLTDADDNGYLKQPSFLRGDYKSIYNEGPVSYSGDGKWVFFTKNNFVNGTRQIPSSGMELSLYFAEVAGQGDWRDPKAFPFNGSGYSTGYAHVNNDGTKVYFASDRPDGYGGYDIYVSTKTDNGWTSPQNLGPVINSPGNEITPYSENGVLYFSSDWHQGLGGYDLFKADYGNGSWNRIFHLGNTINSVRDDYGLIFDSAKNLGYFTSNRLGGKGNEDIYQFSQLSDNIVISVRNATSNAPIANATIDFSACGEASFETNEEGTYSFQALPGLECEGFVRKDGYSESTFSLTSDGRKKIQNIDIFLTREADKYLGRIIDVTDNSSVADVFVRATNQEDGSKLETTSNANGEYRLALRSDKTYVIRYSKVGYTDTHQRISSGDGRNKSMLGTINFAPSSTRISETPLITGADNGDETEIDGNTAPGEPTEREKPIIYGEDATEATADNSTEGSTVVDDEFVQKGFAVQIAAMGLEQKVNPKDFMKLSEVGNLYSRPEKGYKKIRVGIFESEDEAKEAQVSVQEAGFKKAFIVNEILNDTEGLEVYSLIEEDENTEEVITETEEEPSATKPEPPVSVTEASEYLIQLAAYRNPQYFKAAKVSKLGVIEQRKKGNLTIMYLAGFSSLDAAEKARGKVINSGFKGAYVVENKDGEFVKVEM